MDFSSTDPWLRTLIFAGIAVGSAALCWWTLSAAGAGQARQLAAAAAALATVPAAVAAPFEGGDALTVLGLVSVAGFLAAAAAALGPEARRPAPAPGSRVVPASAPAPSSATRVAPAPLATAVLPGSFPEQTVSLSGPAAIGAIAFLVEYSGDGHPHRLGADTSIGRDAGAGIVLDDDATSREHARVKFEDGTFVLYDLGGMNGTRLVRAGRRRRITTATSLTDLDIVETGNSRLVFLRVEVPPR